MADDERINISVWLRDRLTGPLNKIIKLLDQMRAADERMGRQARANTGYMNAQANVYRRAGAARYAAWKKAGDGASYAYSREKRLFEQYAAAEKLYRVGGKGPWFDSATRATATRDRIRMVQDQVDATLSRLSAAEKFAEKMRRITARFTQANRASDKMAGAVLRVTKSFGASNKAATRYSETMRRVWTDLPNVVGRGAGRIGEQMSRIMEHQSQVRSGLAKAWTVGAAVPAVAAGGYAVHQGFSRLNAFEAADVRLGVYGYNEKQSEKIVSDVNEMLLGTFIPLDEGLGLATKLLSTGMGTDVFNERYQSVVDLSSAFAPNDIQGVAMVYGQIENKGILTGEERAQLAERMIPITRALAEHLGKTEAEIFKMIEAKQISSDMVWEVSAKMAPGAGKAMGETFLGSFKLISAAMGRMGYEFDRGFSEQLESLFDTLTETINYLAPMFHDMGSNIGRGMEIAVQELPRLGAALAPLEPALKELFSTIGDVMPEIVEGFTYFLGMVSGVVWAVSKIATTILRLAEPILPYVVPALLVFLHAVGGFVILVTIGNLIKSFVLATIGLGQSLWTVGGMVKKFFTVLGSFKAGAMLRTLGRALASPFLLLGRVLAPVGRLIRSVWAALRPVAVLRVLGRMLISPFMLLARAVGPATALLKSFWVALVWRGGLIARVFAHLSNLFLLIRAGGGIFSVVAGYVTLFVSKLGGLAGIAARIAAPFTWLWRALGGGAGVIRGLTWALRLLGVALRSIPVIGWIITAVWLLIEAFQWAYREVGWFRDAVDWTVTKLQEFWDKAVEVAEAVKQAYTDLGDVMREKFSWLSDLMDTLMLFNGPHQWEVATKEMSTEERAVHERLVGEGLQPGTAEYIRGMRREGFRGFGTRAPETTAELESKLSGGGVPDNAAGLEQMLANGDTGPSDDDQVRSIHERWARLAEWGVPRTPVQQLMAEGYQFGSAEMAKKLHEAGFTAVPLEGFFTGGFTGDRPTTEVAGVVHGREFVVNAWATKAVEAAHPGAMAHINATGSLPGTGGFTYAPTVNVTAHGGADTAVITAAVRAELDRQARAANRTYMTRQLRGAR